MRILVTGGSGMVGGAFLKHLSEQHHRLYSAYFSNPTSFDFCENIRVDISDRGQVMSLAKLKPDLIIHCAAVTGFAFCEANKELAEKVNVVGSRYIAELAKSCNSKLVYMSTDVVFDGLKGGYAEDDNADPGTWYGRTKFEGERACLNAHGNTMVVRTCVFGPGKKQSFAGSIVESLSNGLEFHAFTDVINSPIYIDELVKIVMLLVGKDFKGVFHVVGDEHLSRFEFAVVIAKVFGLDASLIKDHSVDMLADNTRYPKDVSLCNSKMHRCLDFGMPSISDMVQSFLAHRDADDA